MAYDIAFPSSFEDTLPGGDDVTCHVGAAGDPNKIEFCLKTGARVTWWKGVVLIYKSGAYRTVTDIADRPGTLQCGSLSETDLNDPSVQGLYLSKAGFAGVHDNTYKIINASEFQNGQRITFRWFTPHDI